MKGGTWKIAAVVILSAMVLAGAAAAQEGTIQFAKNDSTVTISGSTNLAAGDRLIVTVVSAGFTPTEKGTGGAFGGAGGTAVVQPGSPLNTYSFGVDVSAFPPGEYLVTVESVETGFRASGQFVLPWSTAAPATPAAAPATTGTTAAPAATTPAAAPVPSTTRPVPLPWAVSVGALAIGAGILAGRR